MKNILKVTATIAKARKELAAEKHERWVNATVDRGIHLRFDEFVKQFTDFKTEDFSSGSYDYQVIASVNGVEVFAITTKEEYAEAFPDTLAPEQQRIQELEAEIESMKQSHDEMGLNEQPQPYKIGGELQ